MTLYAVTNPATGEVIEDYPTATDAEIEAALASANAAFDRWRHKSVEERAGVLSRMADLYAERRDELAAIITREMGKAIAQSLGEVDIVISIHRYYADKGPEFLEDEHLEVAAGGTALVRKEGLGVLLGIMPWNYPYYQVARFAAPNLLNGNTILLKHAPQCPESALAMQSICRDAGLPEGAYINLFATNEQVAGIIADPRVQGVSLTGSERAGAAVAEIAGRHLKKIVLELGGSDPFLVSSSANVDKAVRDAVNGRFENAGQACNAAKRLIVNESVYDEFASKLTEAVDNINVGDPTERDTFMGPMSSSTARDNLAEQVQDAIDKGATVLTGGSSIECAGAWYQPTILAGVTQEMRAYYEELFGPVAVVYRVASDDEALALANDSPYGLGAVIETADTDAAQRLAENLHTGMVYVNEPGGSAAELPFGGVKRSGVGRELGRYGMEEFVNRKLIRIAQ